MPLIEVSGDGSTDTLGRRLQYLLEENGLLDNNLVQDSIKLALELHDGQTRTYEPYANHVLRVAIRLIEQFGVTDPEVLAAAVLHDSIEDQATKLIRLQSPEQPVPVDPHVRRAMGHSALQQFTAQYGPNDVADLVHELSMPPTPSELTRITKIQTYLGYTATIMERGDPRARAIKHADFIDNTDAPIKLEAEYKRIELDPKQIGAYALHLAGLEREGSLVVGKIREEITVILRNLEAEASARIIRHNESRAMGSPDTLRSA
jgi:hypothetical protein